jgi:hypothetical protein
LIVWHTQAEILYPDAGADVVRHILARPKRSYLLSG